ncbi:hypothetical protein L249_0379 [Ophiocordyceps polyrhachis-furcata BCC 54312]|uniref:Uncharacterized protein n=1 Tax=Ophiocordyceps polyrhachis-furcata BCC 54312 TaxID=1330021 RepID=A0A367LDG5_9HYPO|nr:hypothetical protein L249_0379 [Ophiocordyceps polyrhachis-furcata BCC 54312]
MALSWDSIFSIATFFGPMLVGRAFVWYRSKRCASSPTQKQKPTLRPVPLRIQPALFLLFVVTATYLIRTIPSLAPENIFVRTQSRLQIPVDVLFNRLVALRPGEALTSRDEALRAKFVNLESRLLYFQFGPEVLGDCPFCNVDEPASYFYYALPDLLRSHLVNLMAIALVTSSAWTGVHGSQWRTLATSAAALLAAADVFIVKEYDYKANSLALRLHEIDFFYWSMRCYRLLSLAALDALLGWLIYLSCTNRAFAKGPSPVERVDALTRALLSVKSKMSAMGIIRNTALRDSDLRSQSQAYWTHEVRLMSEVMEEREVVEGVNDALSNRIDMQAVLRDADAYSQAVLKPLHELGPDV